jgi:hypothetical protein
VTEEISKIVQASVTDTSGKWMSVENAEKMLETVLRECVTLVEDTPKTCAFTTHDLGTVNCTVDKAAAQIRNRFGLKQYYGVFE